MLNLLFGSEARVRILNLFLLHSQEKYYLRQIARKLELQVNSVQRELNNLEKFGLIMVADKAGVGAKKQTKKYFNINQSFILFPEIKALFIKAQVFSSQKFIADLQKICQPKLLILTGIFTNSKHSLTDILVVGRISRRAFVKLIKTLEKALNHEINYTIMDEKEFRYRQTVMDVFIYDILRGKSINLIDKLSENK